jgi:cleavage and polyadenylation specificity factor subunit 1
MAFRDAKLSVVEWDPANNDVQTSSLHYYEEESLRKGRINFDQ